MSISKRKRDANRANAQKSTGPRTQAGLENVSHNAVKHGLLGRFRVLSTENQDEYNELVNQLIREEKPVGLLETELVKKLSEHMWLSQRARQYQEACFAPQPQTPEQKNNKQDEVDVVFAPLAVFMRYETMHDRAYDRTLKNLLRLRKERLTAERGSVSQKRAERADELRENRENRQAETHKWRTATAEIRFEERKFDFGRKVAAAGASDFGKIAA